MGVTRAVNVATESLKDVMDDLKMTEGFDVGLERISLIMSGLPFFMRCIFIFIFILLYRYIMKVL
nr:L-threonine 3-dehydrogenase 2 [Moritella viscosa]SHN99756.1 L-threonine 3-dehydrogenase 2 [Moritella viscosa]